MSKSIDGMKLEDVLAWIRERAEGEDLQTIIRAANTRHKTLAMQRADELTVGMKVETFDIRPAYYSGLRGVLKERSSRGSRGSILLDEASTKRLREAYIANNKPTYHLIPKDAKEHLLTGVPLGSLKPC